ncbi:hypothetical protein FDW87_01000 [Citrobacter sp. wls826]|nr:hypothetical protein FDW87_01000 [Citrobacter sp. wls826]
MTTTITTNVARFADAQIKAYRDLAQKATGAGETGRQDSGVGAALKRFFYKLDFLLKYGRFPSGADATSPDALPEELRGLREFLETSQCAGESYILQKDINTRYRFIWSDTGEITVTEERRCSSPAGTKTGYACKDIWRDEHYSQLCGRDELLSSLNGANRAPAEEPAEAQALGEGDLCKTDTPYPTRHSANLDTRTGIITWDDGSQSVLPPGWERDFASGKVTKRIWTHE